MLILFTVCLTEYNIMSPAPDSMALISAVGFAGLATQHMAMGVWHSEGSEAQQNQPFLLFSARKTRPWCHIYLCVTLQGSSLVRQSGRLLRVLQRQPCAGFPLPLKGLRQTGMRVAGWSTKLLRATSAKELWGWMHGEFGGGDSEPNAAAMPTGVSS